MNRKAQNFRLGLFFIISIVILFVILGYFTTRHIFEQKKTYYVAYQDISVSGLEIGSPVKYLGINIGSISNIKIDPDDFGSIIVELSIKEDIPIKKDAVADIVSIGITGLKTIEIRGGSHEAETIKEYGFITPGVSFADDITGKAEVIAFKTEQVLNNLQELTHPDNIGKIRETIDNISDLAESTNYTISNVGKLLTENRKDIRSTIIAMNELSSQLGETSKELDKVVQRTGEIVHSDTINQVMGNLRDISLTLKEANLSQLIKNFSELTKQSQELLAGIDDDIDRSSKDLSESLILLRATLENLNETSMKINESPSILIRGERLSRNPDDILD